MANAIKAVTSGEMGYKRAAECYGVPKSTLERRVKIYRENPDIDMAVSKGLGRFQSVFTETQELELIQYLTELESNLVGLSTEELRLLVVQLADRNNIPHPFKAGRAGKDWIQKFLNRHSSSLSLRKPEATSAMRAECFNKVVVNLFFDLLENIIKLHQLTPDRIFNVDETGFSTVPKHQAKIFAKKGKKQVGILTSADRGPTVTAEICVAADGHYLPPMFVLPRQRLKTEIMNNTLPGSWAVCHPSGWMQTELFLQWFKWFVKQVKPSADSPVLLILDGHTTHTKNLEVIDYARKNHVIILCLPPHSTHRLQPLDVAVMKPLSTYYSSEIRKWLRQHPGRVVTANDVPNLCCEALKQAAKVDTIINGFKKTGIWPFNRDVFDDDQFVTTSRGGNEKSQQENTVNDVTDNPDESVENQSLDNVSKSLSNLSVQSDTEEEASTSSTIRERDNFDLTEEDNFMTPEPVAHCSKSTPVSSSRTRGFFRPFVPDLDSADDEIHEEINQEINQEDSATTKFINRRKRSSSKFGVAPKSLQTVSAEEDEVVPRKKRPRGKTAVLTSNAYRNELVQKKKSVKKTVGKGRGRPCKNQHKDDAFCIYCDQKYSESFESWTQCQLCHRWAHDSCAGVSDDDTQFICDYCE